MIPLNENKEDLDSSNIINKSLIINDKKLSQSENKNVEDQGLKSEVFEDNEIKWVSEKEKEYKNINNKNINDRNMYFY